MNANALLKRHDIKRLRIVDHAPFPLRNQQLFNFRQMLISIRKAGNEFDALEWRPLQFFAERVSVIDHRICSRFLDPFDRIWPRGSGDHLKLGQLLHELYHDRTYTASAPDNEKRSV